MILDEQIRNALHEKFRRTYPSGTVVIDEFALHGVCADLAAFFEEEIHLWEIKSDADNLRRLARQIERYSLVATSCTLVVGPRHAVKVLPMLPAWWGLQVALERPLGTVELECLRAPTLNPHLSTSHVAELLWGVEVRQALSALGESKGKSRWTIDRLAEHLAQRLGEDELLRTVCKAVRTRRYHMNRRPPRVLA